MKIKKVLVQLDPIRVVVVWIMVVLGCLGLLGAVLLGGLFYLLSGESPGAGPSELAFWFGFMISGGPSVLMVLGAWWLSKRKLIGWLIALLVGVPFGWYLIQFLF